MKKYFGIMFVLALFLGLFAQNSFAQREVTVASVTNGGAVDGLPQAIIADSTARAAALPQRTVYVLENGGVYPIVTEMENIGYYLHIKTTDLAGAKARLVPAPRADQGFNDMFEFRTDGLLENLIIDAMRTQEPFSANRHNIKIRNNATLKVKGCEIAHDTPGAAFSVWEEGPDDRNSLFLEDCFIHSIGHNKSLGGNGRVLGVRSNMDTLSLVNTTFFNLTDRVFRHGSTGWDVKYVKVDHCTGLTTSGFHGFLQLGESHKVVITNNIFMNPIAFGSHYNRVAGGQANEQSQPEDDKMYVVTLDTVFSDSDITVANNNIYWEQQYKDLWASYPDSTTAPGFVNQTLLGANTSPNPHFSEELTFVAPPPSTYAYHLEGLTNINATVYPENFYFGLAEDIDASYGTTAASYTAAGGGFPLGDLNHYPAKKAEWDAAGRPIVTSVDGDNGRLIPANYMLAQNYPNPFNPSTRIDFSLPEKSHVTLSIHNILGQRVKTLIDRPLNGGAHRVVWNGTNEFGETVTSGIYFYQLRSELGNKTMKMMFMK